MASKEHVCDNYLCLKPEEASLLQLVRFLFSSSSIGKRTFIDCSEEEGKKGENFERRWIIIISVILQWVLLLCGAPLARIGDMLEKWLNLVSSNGGPVMLIMNWLRGKVLAPDALSSTSVIGNLDRRIELDSTIKPENIRYKAALSVMASKLSYENKDLVQSVVNSHWKMQFLGFYNFRNERATAEAGPDKVI